MQVGKESSKISMITLSCQFALVMYYRQMENCRFVTQQCQKYNQFMSSLCFVVIFPFLFEPTRYLLV